MDIVMTLIALLVCAGLIGFFVCLIWLIITAILRKPTKKPQTGMLTCIGLLLISIFCFGAVDSDNSSSPSKPSTSVNKSGSSQKSSQSKDDTKPSEYVQAPSTTSIKDEDAYAVTYSNVRTYTDSIGTTWAQIIVEICNTGTTDLYLSTSSYDLEDSNGQLLKSSTMASLYPNVISPGETGYMYEEIILDQAAEDNLVVLPRFSVKRAKIENIRLSVTDIDLSADRYGWIKALGRIENTSSKDQNMIYIVFILFDDAGTPIGQLFTILTENLAPEDKIGFEAGNLSLPDDVMERCANYVVYAYPYQLQF